MNHPSKNLQRKVINFNLREKGVRPNFCRHSLPVSRISEIGPPRFLDTYEVNFGVKTN